MVFQWPPFGTNFPKGDSILSNHERIFKSPRQTGVNVSLGIPSLPPTPTMGSGHSILRGHEIKEQNKVKHVIRRVSPLIKVPCHLQF